MLKEKIIIEVEGGIVKRVFANIPLEYFIIDYDAEAGIWVSDKRGPDEITTDLSGLYGDTEIREQLQGF
jgi:hypothetical protein